MSFDGFRAVDDLSFFVDKEELRAIIGPNGAGKTTVLDFISGRTRADSGSVLFKGEEVSRPARARDCPQGHRQEVPDALRSTNR